MHVPFSNSQRMERRRCQPLSPPPSVLRAALSKPWALALACGAVASLACERQQETNWATPAKQVAANPTLAAPRTNAEARRAFVDAFVRHAQATHLELGSAARRGVALVVFAKNSAQESCLLLGREKGGTFRHRLNFIGGKVEQTAAGTDAEKFAGALYDEVREELGLHLDFERLQNSIVALELKISEANAKVGSLLCFCCLSGIDPEQWKRMQCARLKNKRLPWKYQEMSEIKLLPVTSLARRKDLSAYVRENLDRIRRHAAEANNRLFASIGAFAKVQDHLPMLVPQPPPAKEARSAANPSPR